MFVFVCKSHPEHMICSIYGCDYAPLLVLTFVYHDINLLLDL